MPSVCTNPPEKIKEPAIGSLRAAGGGLRRNPVSSSAGTGRAWAEGELQTPRAPFWGSVVEGKGRRGGAPTARRGGRRGLLCRRGGALRGKMGTPAS
jgi:hypothetical protein